MTSQEKIGLKIKSLREEKEMSQTALAERVGYKDKTAIAKVEAGKVDLPQSKIVAFANALDTVPAYFFDGIEYQEPKTIAAHLDTEDLTEAELEDVASYIEFIRNKRK